MIDFPPKHRLAGIQVSTVRLNMLGGMGDYAKLALTDEQSRPMAMVMSQKFSPRTYELIEALGRSIEQDVHDIFAESDSLEELEEKGVTFDG